MSELPEGWIRTSLSDVGRLVSGAGFPEKLQNKKGLRYPFFKVGNLGEVESGQPLLQSNHTVDDDLARSLRATIIPKDSIAFAKIGMAIRLNRRRLIGVPSCIDNNLMAVIPSNAVLPRYLLRYLETLEFMAITQSTTVPALRKSDLEVLEVPLPPLNEQRHIVAKLEKLLSRVDAAQARLANIPRILKRFRQSVLAAGCSGWLTADWREQNPGACVSDSIREKAPASKNPNELPASWISCLIGNVMRLKNGFAFKSTDYVDVGIPLVRIANIQEGNVTLAECAKLPIEKANWNFAIEKGDLLVAMSGATTGKFGLYDGDVPCLQNQRVGNIRILDPKEVLMGFRNIYLQSLKRRIEEDAYGGAQPNISPTKIESLPFSCPPLAEQQEIVRRVEALFKTADALEGRYRKAKAHVDKLTQSILAKAFRGELVPQDPNDEPASALLARIKRMSEIQTASRKKLRRR